MKCNFTCKQEAACHVRWGKEDSQQANLCPKHIAELWEMASPQIKAGVCFWIQGPVKEQK